MVAAAACNLFPKGIVGTSGLPILKVDSFAGLISHDLLGGRADLKCWHIFIYHLSSSSSKVSGCGDKFSAFHFCPAQPLSTPPVRMLHDAAQVPSLQQSPLVVLHSGKGCSASASVATALELQPHWEPSRRLLGTMHPAPTPVAHGLGTLWASSFGQDLCSLGKQGEFPQQDNAEALAATYDGQAA